MRIEYIYKENTFGDYYVSQGAFEKNNFIASQSFSPAR